MRYVGIGRSPGYAAVPCAIVSLLALFACGGETDPPTKNDAAGGDSAVAVCGNGTLEAGEACDLSDLGGADCTTIGQDFTGGSLACWYDCRLDTRGCLRPPGETACDNGLDDDRDGFSDCSDFDCCRATACAIGIAELRTTADGPLSRCLPDAYVSYVGRGGVYVQKSASGPAIYFERSGLTTLQPGNTISIQITRLASSRGHKKIVTPSTFRSEASGSSIDWLLQDLSDGTPLDESFESELVRIEGGSLTELRSASVWVYEYADGARATISFSDPAGIAPAPCKGMTLTVQAPVIEYDGEYRLAAEYAANLTGASSATCLTDPCAVFDDGVLTLDAVSDGGTDDSYAARWSDLYGADDYTVDLLRADQSFVASPCPTVAQGVGQCVATVANPGSFRLRVTAHKNGCADRTGTSNLFRVASVAGERVETFDDLTLGTTYSSGNFVGAEGLSWQYVAARNQGDYAIEGKGLMLRRKSDGSALSSQAIPGGLASLSIQYLKGFTAAGNRQIELFVNETSVALAPPFDDTVVHTLAVDGLSFGGDVVIKVVNTTAFQVVVDNVRWTPWP